MRSFQAAQFGPPSNFELCEVPLPPLKSGEVRIRVEAAALGYVDTLLMTGRYQIKPELPYVPAGEFAGVVESVGPATNRFQVGDRLVTWQLGGGLADYASVPEHTAFKVPEGLDSVAAAATLLDFLTAHYALIERGSLKRGESVLVSGAGGGVGAAAIQVAAGLGAFVLGIASTEEKRDYAASLGANTVMDPASPDLRAEIRRLVPQGLVDVIVDPVGGTNFEAYFRSLAKEGRHLVVGFAGGPIPSLPANLALLKSASLVGVDLRHFFAARYADATAAADEVLRKLASGEYMRPTIVEFALQDSRRALDAVATRSRRGKVVVLVSA